MFSRNLYVPTISSIFPLEFIQNMSIVILTSLKLMLFSKNQFKSSKGTIMIWCCDSFLLFQRSFNCQRKENTNKSCLCKKRDSLLSFLLGLKKNRDPLPPFFYASQTCPWNWSCLAVDPMAISMLPLFQALVWSRSR